MTEMVAWQAIVFDYIGCSYKGMNRLKSTVQFTNHWTKAEKHTKNYIQLAFAASRNANVMWMVSRRKNEIAAREKHKSIKMNVSVYIYRRDRYFPFSTALDPAMSRSHWLQCSRYTHNYYASADEYNQPAWSASRLEYCYARCSPASNYIFVHTFYEQKNYLLLTV